MKRQSGSGLRPAERRESASLLHPNPSDRTELIRLWMRCFGDPEDYVRLYFDHSFVPEQVFVHREAAIDAMLIRFPVCYLTEDGDEKPGSYLYAVCTAPEFRGRGLCRRLMEQTEQELKARGDSFTCLRAASPKLTKMYEGMGYRTTFANRELVLESARDFAVGTSPACPEICVERVTPAEYYGLRQLALYGNFIEYDPKVLAHQARLGSLLSIDGGAAIGALERYKDTAILKEYLGDEALLPSLAAALDLKKLIVRTPGAEPFAMAKSLTDDPIPQGYLGLAFD